MQSYRLTINDDWFYLSGDYNVSALKAAMTAAVHSGGGFVDIFSSLRSQTSLLITAHSIVKLEAISADELPEPIDTTAPLGHSYIDDDYWLD